MLGPLLADVDVVSFDFFDTLVDRPNLFAPTALFPLVEQQANERGQVLRDFARTRVRAEGIARVRARGNGVGDVTLEEIYREVAALSRLSAADTATLMALELALECQHIDRLASGFALYQDAVAAGKRIVVVSDTYFPAAFLTDLAVRAGYTQIERVFASSAERCTKLDGSLFDRVVAHTGVHPKRILHVGDDSFTDYRGALGRGMKSQLVRTPLQTWKRNRSIPNRTSGSAELDALFVELAAAPPSGDPAIIPEIVAMYAGFALWLAWRIAQDRVRTIYFFARDGRIMKEFFDLVARAAGLDVESRYLYVSRAALYPTVITAAPNVGRQLFAHNWEQLPVLDALRRVGLEADEGAAALAANGLRRDSILGAASRARFEKTLIDLWPLIEERNAGASALAVGYLEQEGVMHHQPTAVVDIGWHGTMQNAIHLLCRHRRTPKEIQGYYLGTLGRPQGADPLYRAAGFLVEQDEPPALRSIIRSSPSLIELLHGAPHGTVQGYEDVDGRIEPVLDPGELDREQYLSVIGPIQERALAHAKSLFGGVGRLRLTGPDPEMVARVALSWLCDPSPGVAEALGALQIVSDVRGVARSITGVSEHQLTVSAGELLPDGSKPMWPAGRRALQKAAAISDPVTSLRAR